MPTLGVFLEQSSSESFALLEGMRTRLKYSRLLPLPASRFDCLSTLARANRVDALAIALPSDMWAQQALPEGFPIVNIANFSRICNFPSIVPDDFAAGCLAAKHFLEWGVRDVFLFRENTTYASALRTEGFCKTLQENGGTVTVSAELPRSVPTAAFATSDILAAKLAKVLPENTPLVGVGDSLQVRVFSGIELTSVQLPFKKIGERAAEVLEEWLSNNAPPMSLREELKPEGIAVRASSGNASTDAAFLQRAWTEYSRDLQNPPTVDELARRLGFSRRAFETHFRQASGSSPASVFRKRRMDLAAQLLQENNLPISEIAKHCGCATVQAFSNLFRNTFGKTPARFRQSSRKLD